MRVSGVGAVGGVIGAHGVRWWWVGSEWLWAEPQSRSRCGTQMYGPLCSSITTLT